MLCLSLMRRSHLDTKSHYQTASTCKALRSVLLGGSCFDTAYLWRQYFRRRWLFGLRRRHRPTPNVSKRASERASKR